MEGFTLKWLRKGFKIMQISLMIISSIAILNSFLILFQANFDLSPLFIIGYILLFTSIILLNLEINYIKENKYFILTSPLILIFLILPFIVNNIFININETFIRVFVISTFIFFVIFYISFFFLFKSFLDKKEIRILTQVTLLCLFSSLIIFLLNFYILNLFLSLENINMFYVTKLAQAYSYLYYSFILTYVYIINFINEEIEKKSKWMII
jgi:hypothetical protein